MSETSRRLCFACRNAVDSDEQFVLARGRQRLAHCSEACVRATLRIWRRARARSRLRVAAAATVAGVLLAGALAVMRHRAPRTTMNRAVLGRHQVGDDADGWPDVLRPGLAAHRRRLGVRVQSGAVGVSAARAGAPPAGRRRPPVRDRRAPASDGVPQVRRLRRRAGRPAASTSTPPSTVSSTARPQVARTSMAADTCASPISAAWSSRTTFIWPRIPRGVVRGARISAGEVIGLLGDTGTGGERSGARPHLHFALSIRPSAEWPETFWDPTSLMATWPLRVPPHGSVAGLIAATNALEIPRRHRGH